MKNILFISYDGMTDPLGQSQVIPYLTGLTKRGYRFTILSCEKSRKYREHKEEIENLLKPYAVKWIPIPYHKTPPVLSSIYDAYQLRKRAKQLHKSDRFDMVHTRPGMPALIGLWMKKKYNVKFLNDIREFYADSRVDGGIWNKQNSFYKIIYHFFKRKEEQAVAINDGIVCLTFAAEKIIKEWPEYKRETPLEVIPCSADTDLFDPENLNQEERGKLQNELGITNNDLIFSYLGSIGGWYLTDEIMRFYKVISDSIPDAKFLFISPVEQHEKIKNAAQKIGLAAEKILVKYASRRQVPALLSLGDYSVFFINPCYSKQSSSPTKHGEIMAMGIPVINNAGVGDVEGIVEKYSAGIILKDFSQAELKRAADSIAKGLSFDKVGIRNGAKEFYGLRNAVKKYQKIYDEIFD